MSFVEVVFKSVTNFSFRSLTIFASIVLINLLATTEATEVKCSFEMSSWSHVGNNKTCKITTAVNLNNFTISSLGDESVFILNLSGNRRLFHLPVKVAESFPILGAYGVRACAYRQ